MIQTILFQSTASGPTGAITQNVQKSVGVEPNLDHGTRLGQSEMVEHAQDQKVPAVIAIHMNV